MYIKETALLGISNPVLENLTPNVTESIISDLSIKEVRAIYPLIRAINSGRLTKNFTFYPKESLIGKAEAGKYTGFSSFVKPYGKPILREHQAQNSGGLFGSGETADVPMGRIVFAGYKPRDAKALGESTKPKNKLVPGTVEGDGAMYVVPAITDPESITRILGGAYHTVSIGSNVEDIYESVSGDNIAKLMRQGKEEDLPPYVRGQVYDGKLSYWSMGPISGVECSFVNVPSDEYAGVENPDIGQEGIRLLVGEKKLGKSKEFNFFDARTKEKVTLSPEDFICDESFFVDSAEVGQKLWWLDSKEAAILESVDEVSDETTLNESQYQCVDHPDMKSDEPAKCPTCGKDMEEVEDEDDDESSNNSPLDNKKENNSMSPNTNDIEGSAIGVELDKVLERVSNLEDEYLPLVEKLVSGAEGIIIPEEHLETFKSAQEYAIANSNGNWDEEAAKFTIAFSLECDEALAAYLKEQNQVSSSESTEVIEQIGFSITDEGVVLYPLCYQGENNELVPLVSLETKEQLQEFVASFETIKASFGLSLSEEEVTSFIEKLTSLEDSFETKTVESPAYIELTLANFVNFYKCSEFGEAHSDLATLVGVSRRLSLTKEELVSAKEAYNIFGVSVLRNFLNKIPEKRETPSADESSNEMSLDSSEVATIEIQPDPVEITDKPVETSSTSKRSDIWKASRVIKDKSSSSSKEERSVSSSKRQNSLLNR